MENLSFRDTIGSINAERRRHHRIPCSAPIEYNIRDQTYRNLSRDISVSGLFIETWNSFPIGEKLTLTFPLADNKRNFRIEGEIVRAEKQGVGIEFIRY